MRKVEKRLRERLREAQRELEEIKKDRQKLRDHLASNLKNAIRIHGEGKYWNMASLIERLSKDMQSVEYFWW